MFWFEILNVIMSFLKIGLVAIGLVAMVVALFSVNLFFRRKVRIHEGSCSAEEHEKDKGIGCCGGGCGR